MHISKVIVIHYLNNLLPSKLYDLQIIHRIIIDHWDTYNRTWQFSASEIVLTALLLIFLFHFFFFSFAWVPHTAIVFQCNFITRDVYWIFTIYFQVVLCIQIPHQLYSQCTLLKILSKNPDPIILKSPDKRAVLYYDTEIYQAKLRSGQKLFTHLLSKGICVCIQLLCSST